jgi:hypothetical protein
MIYYIFKAQIFTVFLSLSHLTALTFPSRVHDYVGGQKGDFSIYELNKGKTLVFEPKHSGVSKNFISFLKGKKYHFNLSYSENNSDKDIEIRAAKKCSMYLLLKETSEYQLFSCPKSLLFVNKLASAVKVNELTVTSKQFISKGPPVYLNNKLIYLKGRAI